MREYFSSHKQLVFSCNRRQLQYQTGYILIVFVAITYKNFHIASTQFMVHVWFIALFSALSFRVLKIKRLIKQLFLWIKYQYYFLYSIAFILFLLQNASYCFSASRCFLSALTRKASNSFATSIAALHFAVNIVTSAFFLFFSDSVISEIFSMISGPYIELDLSKTSFANFR